MSSHSKLSFIKNDLKSGLAVAALSLPVAVAYSEMLGLPPEAGIFTAIFSLLCYAALGSSREMIIGPDSSIVALIASSIFALGGLSSELSGQFIIIITIVTGIIFFIGGFLRLGFISNFLSRPILVGFLNGVAVVLIISQLTKFTGVAVKDSSSIAGVFEFFENLSSIHYPTLLTGLVSLVLIQLLSLTSGRLPSQLVIIVISAVCASIFQLKQFGIGFTPEISSGIPIPVMPDFSLFKDHYSSIIIDASAIVLLSYANTVLVGKSFSKDRHSYNPDKEFFAMGFTDIVCGVFKGFPVSGSSSRTTINIASGAKTKFSMILSALAMILVVLFLSKEFSLIPAAVFAAIIIDAALGLFKIKDMKEIREFSKSEFRISMICMFGVMIIGVLNGILVALVLSFINIISKASHPPEFEIVFDPNSNMIHKAGPGNMTLQKEEIFIYRFDSAMLFFNSDFFRKKLFEKISVRTQLKLVIIDANPVNYLDVTSRNDLTEIINELNQKNIKIVFCSAIPDFIIKLKPWLVKKNLNSEIFYPDVSSAVKEFESDVH